jgi:hypothetical protein
MSSHARILVEEPPMSLRKAVDDLLEVLGLHLNQFLPQTNEPDHPFIQRPDFSRAHALEVLDGQFFLRKWLAIALVRRLQLLLDTVIEDRKQTALIRQRLALYSKRTPSDQEVRRLLKDAISERSASTATITRWTNAETRIDEERLWGLACDIIEERSKKPGLDQLTKDLRQLCDRAGSLLTRNKGKFSIVDHRVLLKTYGDPKRNRKEQMRERRPDRDESDGIVGITWDVPPEYWDERRMKDFIDRMRRRGFKVLIVKEVNEGCTTVVFETTPEGVQAILLAFREDELAELGIIGVAVPSSPAQTRIQKRAFGDQLAISLDEPGANQLIERQLKVATRKEQFIRPWRRLRYFFTPSVARSPLWHTISQSDERAYANPGLAERWRSLRVDLGMALILWPLLTAALLSLALMGFPAAAIEFGVITGLALAVSGAQPCSFLISPLACGAGVLAMGISFGFADAVIFTHLHTETLYSRADIDKDPFVSVVGGLVGLSAPTWRQSDLSLALIVGIVGTIAVSIVLAAWLMAQPQRARGTGTPFTTKSEIGGAIVGAMTGAGIGLIFGLNQLLQIWIAQPVSFLLAFVLVGGLSLGCSTYLRFASIPSTARLKRAAITGLSHAVIAGAVFALAFWRAGTTSGLVLLAASCGLFHSTFFTTAFVVGQRRGGTRAAFAAAALEGALGFTGFVLYQILH